MGRPERPIDPQAGPVQRFAFDLRELRERAGRPSYKELARRAHYAANTLSEAAKGDKLPTLDVAKAFVKVCGGDHEAQQAWERRWWGVRNELQREAAEHAPDGSRNAVRTPDSDLHGLARGEPADVRTLRKRRRKLTALCVAVAVVLAGGVWAVARMASLGQLAGSSELASLYLLRAHDGRALMRIWKVAVQRSGTGPGPPGMESDAKWESKGRLGECYTRHVRGTVPVWHYSNRFKIDGYDQHLYTIESDPARDEALMWGWAARDPHPVCYVYPKPAPGTRPLYRMREGPSAPSEMVIGDGRGHLHTLDKDGYRRYGFQIDQVWYVR